MANIEGAISLEAGARRDPMRWAWLVRPKGAARFAEPLVAVMGRRQERTIWQGMKEYLEGQPASSTSPAT